MLKQVEMGYRFTSDFLDWVSAEHPEAVERDVLAQGGRVVVLRGLPVPGAFPEPAALLVYLCEDAQAWGTWTAHDSVSSANAHADETLAALLA